MLSLVGHIGTRPNLKKVKLVHVMMHLEVLYLDKLKTQVMCFGGETSHKHRKRNNSTMLVSFG